MNRYVFLLFLFVVVSVWAGTYEYNQSFEETMTITATGTGNSMQDTIALNAISNRGFTAKSLYGIFIIHPSSNVKRGFGLSDSGYVWLYTKFDSKYYLLRADTTASLPCTLLASVADAGTDTLLKPELFLAYRVADTTSDTVMTAKFRITAHYMVSE